MEKRSEYCVTVKLIILSLADMQFGSSVLLVGWLMCHVAHLTWCLFAWLVTKAMQEDRQLESKYLQ